ncbi:MAG: histidine kinase dimerization/phospho-acceptor domain-containing protein, partial [Patescibacteria group bacterium]
MSWQIFYNASLIFNVLAEGIICLFLILTVFKKDSSARGVAWLSFGLAFWALFYFLSQITNDSLAALRFFQIAQIGLILVPPSFIDEATSLAGIFSRPWTIVLRRVAYILCSLFIILTLSDVLGNTHFLITTGSEPLFGLNYWGSRGTFFDIFLTYFLLSLTTVYAIFWFGRPKIKKIQKAQLTWIFWSSMIAGIGGSTQFLLFYNVPFPPIGASLIPVYVFGLFYVITRFHLFNLKVVTAELFTVGIWAILIVRIFFARTSTDFLIDGVVLVLSIIFGVLSIRSIINETDQKDRLEDLNLHLNQKVMEQTAEIRTAYEVEKKARIELEELDKAKDQFILTTQHHLRTPITIVKGFLDMAIYKENNLSEEVKTYLNKALAASQNMANLVNDLLIASQMRV